MLYRGQLRDQKSKNWINQDKVWIVNGHVEKIDANFLRGFEINEISLNNIPDDSNQGKIFVGSYPDSEVDLLKLQQRNIKAVICLQSKAEMQKRNINWARQHQLCQIKGIETILNHPINDIQSEASKDSEPQGFPIQDQKAEIIEKHDTEYAKNLFKIAQDLRNLIVDKR